MGATCDVHASCIRGTCQLEDPGVCR
jgi:hypothetical protein